MTKRAKAPVTPSKPKPKAEPRLVKPAPEPPAAIPSNDQAHLGSLTPDPRNARIHTPRNIGMIADALQAVGGGRSIVIDERGTILAGNGTVEAAGQVGITDVTVIDQEKDALIAVRRTGLTREQKVRLAIADNRAAELASWNTDVLAELATVEGVDLEALWGGTVDPINASRDAMKDVYAESPEGPDKAMQRGTPSELAAGRAKLAIDAETDLLLWALVDDYAAKFGSLVGIGDLIAEVMVELANARM